MRFPCLAYHFWGTRDGLTVEEGVLLKGSRICIPPELHDRTLYELHGCHQGIEKMTQRARSNIYWPSIDADIADYVRHCIICAKQKASQTVQLMLPHDIPDGPWQELTWLLTTSLILVRTTPSLLTLLLNIYLSN